MNNEVKSYTDLFSLRGGEYDLAMHLYPHARNQEFLQALGKVRIEPKMTVIDVPSGGEYLRHFLPEGITYAPHEPCDTFYREGEKGADSLLPLPFKNAYADILLSIAGVHHLHDKTELFGEFFRVLKEGGVVVLSDVYEGSDPAKFLDGYVGDNNTTGHAGVFLNSFTAKELQNSGFSILSETIEKFYWVFDDMVSMEEFCNTLFDIRNVPKESTTDTICKQLGIEKLSDGKIGMKWELLSIVALKG